MILALGGLGSVLVVWGFATRYEHSRLGFCNMATIVRAGGSLALAGLLLVPGSLTGNPALAWSVVSFATLVLLFDALDGWAARRANLQSWLGARLDVEADVAFAVVMAALAVLNGKAGFWFLALGALRPAYLLLGLVWPVLRTPLQPALWRKTLAATQMVLQVVILLPPVVSSISYPIATALLIVMIVSFGIDMRRQVMSPKPSCEAA